MEIKIQLTNKNNQLMFSVVINPYVSLIFKETLSAVILIIEPLRQLTKMRNEILLRYLPHSADSILYISMPSPMKC